MGTPLPTWEDIRWLREEWGGPFAVKGIMHPDDARRAVDVGATAISVSNHGGNNLDGTPASIRALPRIVDAVGDQIEVLQDGGIRRGSDVVKALAFGAKAVMIGRAYLWGMAAGGEAGVSNVLSILRSGVDEALLGLGRSSIHELVRDDLIVAEDFTRELQKYTAPLLSRRRSRDRPDRAEQGRLPATTAPPDRTPGCGSGTAPLPALPR
jgi:L-lactate dehydrogenase (cytochrome)